MSQTTPTRLCRVQIDGLFRTVTPTHISDVGSGMRYDPATDRIVYGESVGVPVTGQRCLTFRLIEEGGAVFVKVPVLPANGLRGRLRRAAAAELEESFRSRDRYVTWQTYQGMHCGAVTGNPDGSAPPLDQVRAIRDNLFMGLFGGGQRMTPSRLRVSTALPLIEGLVELGAIPDGYKGDVLPTKDLKRMMSVLPIVRRDDLGQYLDPNAERVVANYDDVMHAEFLKDTARRAERGREATDDEPGDDKKSETPRGLRALSAIQVITPGTPFYVRFDARCTEAQAGLLLHALLRILSQENGGIGGKSAVGYGRFTHALTLDVDGERVEPFEGQFENTKMRRDSDLLTRLVSAFEADLAQLDPDALDAIITARDPGAEEGEDGAPKAAKGKGKAAKAKAAAGAA